MKKPLIIISLCFVLFLLSSCAKVTSSSQEVVDEAIGICKRLCLEEKEKGISLENGPCIGNPMIKDWVCDIAHSPRQPVDNNPDNQCSAFRNKQASHFVELDENCKLIKYH